MRVSFLVVFAGNLVGGGCAARGERRPVDFTVTAMSWNVQGNVTLAGDVPMSSGLATQIAAIAPDFVALQECAFCDRLLDQLPERYRLIAPTEAGVAIAYDGRAWAVAASGELVLGDDDDGWGPRRARWARFRRVDGESVIDVYSTHFCVSVRSRDDRCSAERQRAYAEAIVADLHERASAAAIIAGDLNVFEGFEAAPAVRFFTGNAMRPLVDVFRAAHPKEGGATFAGNDFAPPGRIDYLLATRPVRVLLASTPEAPGLSDHRPVVARLAFSGL